MDETQAFGRKISGRYLLEDIIGRGSFGEVYAAKDEMLGRTVALKLLSANRIPPTLAKDHLDQFLAEARTIASLDHPNVVPVYDAGVEQGTPWLAMKLVRGEALDRVLAKEKRLGSDRVVRLLAQAARALDHAHRKGIIHRDIKPSNILLGRNEDGTDHLWLADFGIAKILSGETVTLEDTVAGTPAYMSPEQISGKRIDARTDIFALGCVACELLTGRQCFGGDTYAQIVFAVVHETPAGINELTGVASASMEAVIRRALAKSPEDRFQTAEEFFKAIDAANRPKASPGDSVRKLFRQIWP